MTQTKSGFVLGLENKQDFHNLGQGLNLSESYRHL